MLTLANGALAGIHCEGIVPREVGWDGAPLEVQPEVVQQLQDVPPLHEGRAQAEQGLLHTARRRRPAPPPLCVPAHTAIVHVWTLGWSHGWLPWEAANVGAARHANAISEFSQSLRLVVTMCVHVYGDAYATAEVRKICDYSIKFH